MQSPAARTDSGCGAFAVMLKGVSARLITNKQVTSRAYTLARDLGCIILI
mgnify:CR=1 FL=1